VSPFSLAVAEVGVELYLAKGELVLILELLVQDIGKGTAEVLRDLFLILPSLEDLNQSDLVLSHKSLLNLVPQQFGLGLPLSPFP
jgi:hypothetical protein